jgi:hypothetical protein
MTWLLSSSSDRRALDVVDGAGPHEGRGPHYSRRTPGARTFTGIGQEVVLVTDCGRAVWAVTLQKGPDAPFSGWRTRHLDLFKPARDAAPRREHRALLWRNVMFRNLGAGLSSDLIREATARTYEEWIRRYGGLPAERLRTEVEVAAVRSTNPGYCYVMAGWERGETRRGKLHLWAPPRDG